MRIAKNVKAARLALGITQEQAAQRAGVTVRTISRLEQGQTSRPREDEFRRIAEALGTTPDALMGMDDDQAESQSDDEGPTDDELNAEISNLLADSGVMLAFMSDIRDPHRLSRTARLVIREDLRKIAARQRRQG